MSQITPKRSPMARTGRFKDQNQFAILEETDDNDTTSADPGSHSSQDSTPRVLRPIAVDQTQNTAELTPNGLAARLEKLHIRSPTKQAPESILKNKSRGLKTRPSIGSDTFVALRGTQEKHAHFEIPSAEEDTPKQHAFGSQDESLEAGALSVCANDFQKSQLRKHSAGQFDYVLRVPLSTLLGQRAAGSSRKTGTTSQTVADDCYLYFGCNVLHPWIDSPGRTIRCVNDTNSYAVVATSVDANRTPLTDEQATKSVLIMTSLGSSASPSGTRRPAELQLDTTEYPRISPKPSSDSIGSSFTERCGLRSPGNPLSRIEDSFEAIDQLEEQLEAMNAIVHIKRVPSPDKMPSRAAKDERMRVSREGLTRALSTSKRPTNKSASVRVKSTQSSTTRSLRRTSSAIFRQEDDKEPPKSAEKRSTVTRPASLLPPKPLAKSSRPPTLPTFELPGEAVARKLKEQREARMSQAALPAAKPPIFSPQRTRSTKPPTRPNFELPGEAISRRKREEREAKLRAQEEEERKKREFKARPVRISSAPSSYPKETITSRARQQSKAASGDSEVSPAKTPKRQSIAAPSGNGLAVTASALNSRGRCTTLGSPSAADASRATSTSTGSVSGKRSTVSTDEVTQQRQRGKEILQRDNSYSQEREREKRDREEAARIAREEAAERSRLLSREWALKQKLKAMAGGSSPSRAMPV